jgi:hypothetical protein
MMAAENGFKVGISDRGKTLLEIVLPGVRSVARKWMYTESDLYTK